MSIIQCCILVGNVISLIAVIWLGAKNYRDLKNNDLLLQSLIDRQDLLSKISKAETSGAPYEEVERLKDQLRKLDRENDL